MQRSEWGRDHHKRIRKSIERGVLPGFPLDEIMRSLGRTRPPNVFEVFGFLSAVKTGADGVVKDFGLVSCEKVTTAFTEYLVDSLQDSTTYPMDAFKYHACGTGTTAESNTQTALVTEVESREIGTQIEGATANIYKSVATHTFTGTHSIAEHGLFSAAAVGTMLDRSLVTPAIPVILADEIEWTYQLTVNPEA